MKRSSEPDDLVAVGKITRTVGLDGLCVVEPSGFTLETINVPCRVKVGFQENAVDDILLEKIEFRPNCLVCRFENRHDKDSAEQLRGKIIYTKKSELPSLNKDEFYHFELIGMMAFTDKNNELIGNVSEVHNFPSADTLEITPVKGGESLLVPLTGESIVSVDKKSGKIIFKHSFVEDLL